MITLRDYQESAEESIWRFLASMKGNPLCCLPTATGKSLVIGSFAAHALQRYPATRILVCTHVKELLIQNSNKLKEIWPCAPYGIFSAGLKQREAHMPIVFAGIGTAIGSLELLGRFDLVLIDEAHLMSGKIDSMYSELIKHLLKLNPNLRVIGFTATPYRMGQGLLTECGIFTHVCFDMTTPKAFLWLLNQGYLAMPIPKRPSIQLNVSQVKLTAGEFNQKDLEEAVDIKDTNYLAVKETVTYGTRNNRNCWLTFASSLKHAEHLKDNFSYFGITTTIVHSKMKEKERDTNIADYKAGKYRCLVNKGIFTTGHDHPPIDLIADLAPTMSTGLHVQKIGRGMRPFPGKENCLVLDFAGNTARLGPINDPVLPKRRGQSSPGPAPVKVCEQCGTYNHASARICYVCGFEFPANVLLNSTAGTEELIRKDEPELITLQVDRVTYSKYMKNGINILKANYVCGIFSKPLNEVVCLEHTGYALHQAHEWWKLRMGSEAAPPTVEEALRHTSKLAVPKSIVIDANMQYPKIYKWEF